MTSKKLTAMEELQFIEEALVRGILEASALDLRQDFLDAGDNPEELVAEFDATAARAKAEVAKKRLEQAKLELAAWRSKSVNSQEARAQEDARKLFSRLQAGDPAFATKMTMAARKGEGLSDRVVVGLGDDFVDLERLGREVEQG